MAEKPNFLLGKGERLTEPVSMPGRRQSPRRTPYTFGQAKRRVLPMVTRTADAMAHLPDLACPHDEGIGAITLHPEYIAKSYYPAGLLRHVGLRTVGSRPRLITPERRSKGREPEETITTQIFVAGQRRNFTEWAQATGQKTNTLRWMLGKYHSSQHFRELAARTQGDYEQYRKQLIDRPLQDGSKFGDVPFSDIDMFTIRQYLDTYRDKRGRLAPVAANRHIQYLKAAWTWAVQRYQDVPPNPCTGVTLNRESPRERLVTPDEYVAALAMATGYLPIMMELAYLCRARRGEVLALRRSDELEDGLRLVRLKGSEGEITAWTPRLRAAVDAAKAFNAGAPTPISGAYLIHDKHGHQINKNAFDSAWRRLMTKVEAAGIERFTFHDLKAMGASSQKDNFAGHRDKSGKMRKTYVRKLQIIQPPE